MKRLLLFVCALSASYGMSQTTIYEETFETGNTFTLNTADLGGASTFNTWLVNNTYSGGAGTFMCLGFPFSFTVANTPSQPVGITGAPSSNYMHISAQSAISSGILCASYIPSDGGTCVTNESNFSKMTASISTLGFTNVMMDFWWMCAGSADAFGEVYYSLNGGTTWTLKQSNMNNVTTWSQMVLSDPAWDNQSSIQFAFRFVNNTGATAADPAFSVDEILVTGMGATNSISIVDIQPQLAWCFGDIAALQVQFDATGTYNVGNVFTLELSDASGSFAAATSIGTLTSSMSGIQMIIGSAPGTVPVGNGYRMRVVASDPATIGADNGTDIIVYPLPAVSSTTYGDVCENGIPFPLTGGMPSGGSYTGSGVSGGNFSPFSAGVGTANIDYTIVDANGCTNTVTETITVLSAPTVQFNLAFTDLCVYAAPYTFTEGAPAGGTYSGPGVTGDVFDPATAGVGAWTVIYDYTAPNGCSGQSSTVLQVTPCASLPENGAINYSIYPNPTEGNFTLVSDIDFDIIELKDLNGRLIQTLTSNELIDVSEFSAGVYIIEMTYSDQHYS